MQGSNIQQATFIPLTRLLMSVKHFFLFVQPLKINFNNVWPTGFEDGRLDVNQLFWALCSVVQTELCQE